MFRARLSNGLYSNAHRAESSHYIKCKKRSKQQGVPAALGEMFAE
jgi:hypothetical protein